MDNNNVTKIISQGHLLRGDLNAHVTTGNHDTVRLVQNAHEVPQAGEALDLGDDLDSLALFPQDFPDLADVIAAPVHEIVRI